MIMQLVDEGLARRWIPPSSRCCRALRLGDADVGATVTVRHLLTHTSGIDGDVFTDTGRGDDCVERYVGLLAEVPSVFTRPARRTPTATAASCCSAGSSRSSTGQSWDEVAHASG